jgi:hypothetical protein
MPEKFDINVELKNGNEFIITHREGEAPEIEVPQQLKYDGNIDSPGNFFALRNNKSLIERDISHVSIDKRALTISLIIDEKHSKRTEIIGTLKKNPDLEGFGIWSKVYRHEEIIQFLRKNRRFFKSKVEYDKILKELSAFKYERNQAGKVVNDRKGNVEDNFKQVLNQNVSLELSLSIPLFEGFSEKTFHVEIFPEITDANGIRFWFESIELIELQDSEATVIFDREIKRFKDILIMYKK